MGNIILLELHVYTIGSFRSISENNYCVHNIRFIPCYFESVAKVIDFFFSKPEVPFCDTFTITLIRTVADPEGGGGGAQEAGPPKIR